MRILRGVGLLGCGVASVATAEVINVPASDVAALVAAINTANANSEDDVINLAASSTYTLTSLDNPQNGLPTIKAIITINGNGATITRDPGSAANFRILEVGADGVLTLNQATISGGNLNPSGAGIRVTGQLHATGVTVTGNTCTGGACQGGGIYIQGNNPVTLTDTTITQNSAAQGGGLENFNAAPLTLTRCTVSNNTATREGTCIGGGVSSHGLGQITIVDSTIHGNQVLPATGFEGYGGGIADAGGAAWTIEGTTISNNTVNGSVGNELRGGGIAENGQATWSLRNVTLTSNGVTNANAAGVAGGGGISSEGGGTWTLNNVTISHNTVTGTSDNGSLMRGGGGIQEVDGTFTITNSIVADNNAGLGPDCLGDVTSGGHTLIENVTDCTVAGATGDIVGQDPQLGVLGANGGPTQTRALQAGSPAIDAADPGAPGSGGTTCEEFDQRGLCRPGGERCDIGAFEVDGIACMTTTTVVGGTTTTTLVDCGTPAADFTSTCCRIDRLQADVAQAEDLGRLDGGLTGAIEKARAKKLEARDHAASGDERKAGKNLKKAIRRLRGFIRKVKSRSGRKVIPEATRTRLLGQAEPLLADMKTLLGAL